MPGRPRGKPDSLGSRALNRNLRKFNRPRARVRQWQLYHEQIRSDEESVCRRAGTASKAALAEADKRPVEDREK